METVTRPPEADEGDRGAPPPYEHAPVALYRTTADGRLLAGNSALVRLLAYPDLDTLRGVNTGDIYAEPGERETWMARVREGGQASFEMQDRRHDGRLIWVRDRARAVRDGSGRIVCFEGCLEPIEEPASGAGPEDPARFPGEATVRWTAADGALDWSGDVEGVLGSDPRVAGASVERLWAWWRARLHPEDRGRVLGSLAGALEDGVAGWRSEYRLRLPGGGWRRLLDRAVLSRSGDGSLRAMHRSLIDLDRVHPGTGPGEGPRRPPPDLRTPDATLLALVAAGDRSAFEEFHLRHEERVRSVARSITAVAADVDDVVSRVFVEVWRKAGLFDARRGAAGPWVAGIARARAVDQLRRGSAHARKIERVGSRQAFPTYQVRPEPVERIAAARAVRAGLDALPDAQRRCIELAYLEGLSHREIAAAIQAPLGTVKTRIRSAMRTLRSTLAPGGTGSGREAVENGSRAHGDAEEG